MSSGIGIDHHKEIAIYAVLTFVAMLSLTLMAPVINEFIIDRFDASNSFVDRFTVAFFIFAFPLHLIYAFGFGSAERGRYQALLLFPFVLLQYPFGKLSDRIGRAFPLIVGSFFYGLEMCLVGFVDKTALIAVMLGCGVFAAMMFPSSIALTGDISPQNKRGAAIGAFNVFGSLGFVAGFSAAGILSDIYGYCTSFVLGGFSEILVVLIAIPFLLKLRFNGIRE